MITLHPPRQHTQIASGPNPPRPVPMPGHAWVAGLLTLCTVVVLVATSRDVGLTWDEPIYIEAAESYMSWFGLLLTSPAQALDNEDISAYWAINHEHPPIDKVWSGLVWEISRNTFDDLTAHRLGNILLAAALTGFVDLMVSNEFGVVAGLMAAGALLTMPRLFLHAHLASLDLPGAVAIFGVCLLFWWCVARRQARWTILLGLAYGVVLGTKVTALLEVPLILLGWTVLFRRRAYLFARIVLMGGIGLGTSLALWPWLYHDSWQRLVEYVEFMTVDHYGIEQWYLHHLYMPPPWHYPFVITLSVVPLTTAVLAAVGSLVLLRRRHPLGGLLLIGALVPMLILASGRSQMYDGERLWMPSFPFIAALAGVGFGRLVIAVTSLAQRMKRAAWSGPLVIVAAGAALAPQVVSAGTLYPHLLSYYSETIGGMRGANRLGLETTYWAETYAAAIPYLNACAPPGAMVWAEAHDVLLYYQVDGQLRSDLRISSRHGAEGIVKGAQGYTAPVEDADFLVVQNRQSGLSGDVTAWMADASPNFQVTYNNTPLLQVYSRGASGCE